MKCFRTHAYLQRGGSEVWTLDAAQGSRFSRTRRRDLGDLSGSAPRTSPASETTFNAPGRCGWHSGRDSSSDDYFVPGGNAARGNRVNTDDHKEISPLWFGRRDFYSLSTKS
ncbi:hypothetical protein F2P81_003349 [Scophthalmus maximus]|uniref:Uncharacterized protein n=1 Tax=Scophthalmus maximus TaxID=52904 RepID=A0A6A4TN41_SCOMX|nr:hypothetical protein F2P81_003349 [Scophthalmus maximus]